MSDNLQEPEASPAEVAQAYNRLQEIFPRADYQDFLQMIWALDALRAKRPEAAAQFLRFPNEAVNQGIGSPYAVHQWELETLVIQLLLNDPSNFSDAQAAFDCRQFHSVAGLVNRLRKLEDLESAVYLRNTEFDVFGELHRIAQRQFHWQRGYHNLPQFYRYAFIYGQGNCAKHFEQTYGLPIAEFNFAGFVLFTHSMRNAWMSADFAIPELGLTSEIMKKAMPLLACSLDRAREDTRHLVEEMNRRHGRPIPTAFLPAVLRRFPILSSVPHLADKIIAPIPEIVLMRVTAGLYYDIVSGGQALLNEASDRFEIYSADLISAMLRRFDVRRAYRYELKRGAPADTPDILVTDGDRLAIVAECKATKLSYLAQFAENPFEAEKKQYLQIARGVVQVWRFFSHVRRKYLNEAVDNQTAGMVLTLDSFLSLAGPIRAAIFEEANKLADNEDDIAAEDRRFIVICSISSVESVVANCSEDGVLAALRAAREKKYEGWDILEIARDAVKEKTERKKYPFVLDELLPWWKRTEDFGAKVQQAH